MDIPTSIQNWYLMLLFIHLWITLSHHFLLLNSSHDYDCRIRCSIFDISHNDTAAIAGVAQAAGTGPSS